MTGLSLSNIVNVQLNLTPTAPSRKNFGMMALFTPEAGNVFNNNSTLYQLYTSQTQIEADFGTDSETAKASSYFWMQTPKPKQMLVARWLRTDRSLNAVKASLRGTPVTTSLNQFKQITDGCFSIVIKDKEQIIQSIDLTGINSFNDIATSINSAGVTNATVIYDAVGTRFIVEAKTAGSAVTIGYVKQGTASGAYLGSLLKLEDGQAQIVKGADTITLNSQTVAEAMSQLNGSYNDWWAATFAAQLTDEEIVSGANWVMAADKVLGVTTTNPNHIENVDTNIFKDFKDRQMYRVVAIFDKNDPYAITSFLARGMSVDFSAQNSTLTMKFKQLIGISPDTISETEAAKCKALGINYYTYYDQSAMVAEGTVCGGRFFDEIHILDWFVDAVQKEVFTVLYKSPTKVPLTDPGQERILSGVRKACREGVKNGAFAPGIWTGDAFGQLATDDYLESGYYVWADTVDNLSSDAREQRRSQPIQTALKMAGAIHSADIIVNFVR